MEKVKGKIRSNGTSIEQIKAEAKKEKELTKEMKLTSEKKSFSWIYKK